MKYLLFLVVVVSACRQQPPAPALAPVPVEVQTSTASAWSITRTAPDWVISQGDLHLHVMSPTQNQREVTGLSLGQGRGPITGLLQGHFAPLLMLPTARLNGIKTKGSDVWLSFDDGRTTRARRDGGRVELVVLGAVQLALPASNTPVRGLAHKKPMFSTEVTAGQPPRLSRHEVDELYIDSARWGTVKLAPACAEAAIVRPIPRGSTSVFVVEAGAGSTARSWRPDPDKKLKPCASNSSTITIGWPLPS